MPVWRVFEHPPKIHENVKIRFSNLLGKMKEHNLINIPKSDPFQGMIHNPNLNKEDKMKSVLRALGL